jgi:PAS domain S-box-containing protein
MARISNTVQILVIEEQRSERDQLERELREAHFSYRISTCAGNEEAVVNALHPSNLIDIVLCPFSLVDTNALKLLHAMRNAGVDVPFILLAFELAEEIAIELLADGVEDYVQCSSLKRLPVVISKAIQRHQTVSELRKSRSKIQTSERALRSMVRNMPMAVVMLDTELRLLVASDVWMNATGNADLELTGRHYHEIIPNQPDHWKSAQVKALAGESISEEGERFNYQGTDYWTRWKLNPWYSANGNVGGLVIFSEDITHERELKLSLQRSEASLNASQRSAKMGSWEWNVQTNEIWGSKEFHRIFELGDDAGLVSFQELISRAHPDDRIMLVDRLNKRRAGEFIDPNKEILQIRVIVPSGAQKKVQAQLDSEATADGLSVRLWGTMQEM